MRATSGRRILVAAAFAVISGCAVAIANPVDHVKADLRADTHGIRQSLHVAAHDLENYSIAK